MVESSEEDVISEEQMAVELRALAEEQREADERTRHISPNNRSTTQHDEAGHATHRSTKDMRKATLARVSTVNASATNLDASNVRMDGDSDTANLAEISMDMANPLIIGEIQPHDT